VNQKKKKKKGEVSLRERQSFPLASDFLTIFLNFSLLNCSPFNLSGEPAGGYGFPRFCELHSDLYQQTTEERDFMIVY